MIIAVILFSPFTEEEKKIQKTKKKILRKQSEKIFIIPIVMILVFDSQQRAVDQSPLYEYEQMHYDDQ